MANEEQLSILKQGTSVWNKWRIENPQIRFPDLRDAYLDGADLLRANLGGADLRGSTLNVANLDGTNLHGANLRGVHLPNVGLAEADLRGVDLRDSFLAGAFFVHTRVDKAKVSGSYIYAINVWDLEGEFEEQKDLIITPVGAPVSRHQTLAAGQRSNN